MLYVKLLQPRESDLQCGGRRHPAAAELCDDLFQANVVIMVEGMEGAPASVLGGPVSISLIGVPTSIGYGAGYQADLLNAVAVKRSTAETVHRPVLAVSNGDPEDCREDFFVKRSPRNFPDCMPNGMTDHERRKR